VDDLEVRPDEAPGPGECGRAARDRDLPVSRALIAVAEREDPALAKLVAPSCREPYGHPDRPRRLPAGVGVDEVRAGSSADG
jgi:hypothetical protein